MQVALSSSLRFIRSFLSQGNASRQTLVWSVGPRPRPACSAGGHAEPFCFYTRARMQNNYNSLRDKSPLLGNRAHVIANDSRILYLIRLAVLKNIFA